ncbi:MAG: hypothetical protein M3374_06865 [Pseudomonadota bacterium]|nr:hypothetical protein [Pseudomonadota bacterium]
MRGHVHGDAVEKIRDGWAVAFLACVLVLTMSAWSANRLRMLKDSWQAA